MHGGTARADSDGEGAGATFEILIPAALTPKSSPVISTVEPDNRPVLETTNSRHPPMMLSHLRVLVVDDDPEARELISMLLSASGIHVDTVASASEGLLGH